MAASVLLGAGTAQAQYYTAPFGPGGTWNLYEVSNTTATMVAAHVASVSRQAQATGVSGVAGNSTSGHLVHTGSWAENAMVALMALRHTNSSNVWVGLTDSDDPALGGAGWVDAGNVPTSDQWFWAGTTGGTGPGGALRLSEGGGYQAFFTGEPNNAGAAGEDAVEMRTDGRWNDNAANAAATLRRYVIEYDINSAAPVAGAVVINPFFTAPWGPGGTWNLYMIVGEGDTWLNAHTRATAMEAGDTTLLSLAGNTTRGHLLAVNSRVENSWAVSVMNRMLTFNHTIGANVATTNTWLGLTDSDDAGLGATEAGTVRDANWIWAGTSGGTGPNGNLFISEILDTGGSGVLQFWADATTPEPNNSGGANWPFGEDAGELRGDGKWNDLPHKIGPANNSASTIVRRYIIEWPLNSASAVPEAAQEPVYFTAQTGTGGTWNLYQLDNVQQTWQAYADRYANPVFNPAQNSGLASLAGNLTAGHLVEIADQYEHGIAYRLGLFQAAWIGLTDNEAYGGMESGNASNNPTNQVQPFWVWNGTTSANTYRRWNAAEPNDSGGIEDAGEMTGSSFYNDNRMDNVNGAIRRGLIEWDIQSATPIAGATQLGALIEGTRTLANAPAPGVWAIREIYDPIHGSWFSALRNANASATNGRVFESTSPVINFNDRTAAAATPYSYPGWGDPGLFSGDLPYLGDTPSVDDNYITRIAQTRLVISAEDDYTFNIHADDGGAFRIAGQVFTSINERGLGCIDGVSKDTIFVPYGTGDTNMRGVVHLAPGTYDLEWIGYEATSGSSYEISYARGAHVNDEDGAGRWALVGNPAAQYPTPLLPTSIANAAEYEDGLFGLHVVTSAGTLNSVADALAALQNTGIGTHTYGKSAVINHSDDTRPGTGGIFAGELDLPGLLAGAEDNDFAVHATGRLVIATPGFYTLCARTSEWVALRVRGQSFANVSGEWAIDPVDPSTVYSYRTNNTNNIQTGEFVSRAVINLPAGCHDVDFITGDREGAFFMELYAVPGNFINTAEYTAAGPGNGGLANPTSNDYRLIGYKSTGTLTMLGVDANGWNRRGTTPATTTQPAGWPGTNIANHETWLLGNGVTADSTTLDTVNERDPQNPTTDAGIPNGRNIWRQTTNDDNYLDEGFDAMLVVPGPGTYSIGWQGDDGGFVEIQDLPAGVQFSPRFEAMAVPTPTVTNAANGTLNGRIQLAVSGGNTRTISSVTFPGDGSVTYPASYPIKSLHFEGTGGCYWEIFAGPANGHGRMVTLLERNAASTAVADVSGIQLAGPDLDVIAVAWAPGPAFSFTFTSVSGVTYTIWRSPDLMNWTSQGTILADDATTTYTSGPIGPGETRFFYRASK